MAEDSQRRRRRGARRASRRLHRRSSTHCSGSGDSSRWSTTTEVENIIIVGHDNVLLELVDGTLIDGPPVADSDQELIDFLVFLASRSEVNARSFSEAQPGSTCGSTAGPVWLPQRG